MSLHSLDSRSPRSRTVRHVEHVNHIPRLGRELTQRGSLLRPQGREWPAILLMFAGMALVGFGLLTAASGFGLPFLICAPLLVVSAVGVAPSKKRIAVVGLIFAYCVLVALAAVIVSS